MIPLWIQISRWRKKTRDNSNGTKKFKQNFVSRYSYNIKYKISCNIHYLHYHVSSVPILKVFYNTRKLYTNKKTDLVSISKYFPSLKWNDQTKSKMYIQVFGIIIIFRYLINLEQKYAIPSFAKPRTFFTKRVASLQWN